MESVYNGMDKTPQFTTIEEALTEMTSLIEYYKTQSDPNNIMWHLSADLEDVCSKLREIADKESDIKAYHSSITLEEEICSECGQSLEKDQS